MVQSGGSNELKGPDGVLVLQRLPVGTRLRLTNGAVGEITANPGDGAWIEVRFLENPEDATKVGGEEWVFWSGVQAVVSEAPQTVTREEV